MAPVSSLTSRAQQAVEDGQFLASTGEQTIFGVATAFLVLAVGSVATRFVGRKARKQPYGADDWLCLASLASFIVLVSLVYWNVIDGHAGAPDLSKADMALFERIAFAIQWAYGFTMAFIRLAIIALEYRIFYPYKSFRIGCYAMGAFVIAWLIFTVVGALALCQPLQYYWDKTIPGGHCGNQNAVYQAIAGLGIVSDLMIFIAPLPMIWRLNMQRPQKLAVIFIFALGLFDIVAGTLRLVATTIGVTKNVVQGTSWGVIEPAVAIIVACAPTYRSILESAGVTNYFKLTFSTTLSFLKRSASRKRSRPSVSTGLSGLSHPGGTFSRECSGKHFSHTSSPGTTAKSDNEIELRRDVDVYLERA